MKPILATLFATLVFVAPILVVELHDASAGHSTLGSLSLGAAIVTPLLWWWLVARRPRPGFGQGALAGALSLGAAVLVMGMRLATGLLGGSGGRSGGWGDSVAVAATAMLFAAALPVGAAVGGLVALAQAKWFAGRAA